MKSETRDPTHIRGSLRHQATCDPKNRSVLVLKWQEEEGRVRVRRFNLSPFLCQVFRSGPRPLGKEAKREVFVLGSLSL